MADKLLGCFAGRKVPQPQGLVPGGAEGELAVAGQDHVLDKVVVTLERLSRDSVD